MGGENTATLNKAGATANNCCAVNNNYYNYCNNCFQTQGAQYHWLNYYSSRTEMSRTQQ